MFATVYQGDGRFEIIVINNSDRELKLQDKVKIMQWSTGKEVEGDNEKIIMEILTNNNFAFGQDWIWPTVSRDVSGFYGERENGTYSDHVNIAGTAGDEVYAVADGVVMETAFESACGNFIVVDLGDGITVKYGHLKEIKVAVGDEIKQGQVLAAMGQTGMASGPNLFFAVTVDGENVNPLAEE